MKPSSLALSIAFVFILAYRHEGLFFQNNLINQRNTIFVNHPIGHKMKIKIGAKTFMATLYENQATEALKRQLPITLKMTELNDNEKYAQLATNLPTSHTGVGTIQEGDLMLWGSNTLVLFYKTFKTSYQYTRLGRVDDPNGLVSAVGSGDATVTFSLD
jgi:hypothetical protein